MYTGRGPVCGTMMRGRGICGCAGGRGGGAGLVVVATGGATVGGTGGAGGAVTAGGAAWTGGGAAVGGGAGRGGAGAAGGTLTAAAGGGGGAATGLAGCGTTSRGGGAAAGGGATTGAFATGAAGLASAGGLSAGRAGAAGGGACCLLIAFRTSPGLEMWERSILVLISSASVRLARGARPVAVCASAAARKWCRTFSASCSSRELECVFFSLTPISGSRSRIALLLTSSSLARSLTRILVIRPFLSSGPSR